MVNPNTVAVTNDPNVRIPKAITAGAKRADDIHKIAYPNETPPAANGDGAPPAETPPAEGTPPVETAPPPPPEVPPETQEDWRGRYNSLKGRFDQQQGQLQNQASRIASLETMIAGMQQPPPQTTTATPPKSGSKRVKPEEVEEYGADFVDVVQRAALDAITPLLDDAVGKVRTEFRADIGKVNSKATTAEREAAVSTHQRLLDALDRQLPKWRTINKHPKFLNWLNLTDPLSGAIRRNLLNDAVAQGNASRAATFYSRFLAEEGDPTPAVPANSSAPAATNGAGNGTDKGLEKFAAPGRPAASGSPPPPATPEPKETISRAQISAFYANKAKGAYTAERAAELEAEIFEANREGRIR